jgi:hypothetical protein
MLKRKRYVFCFRLTNAVEDKKNQLNEQIYLFILFLWKC